MSSASGVVAVGAFDHHLGFDLAGVGLGNLAFQRGGDQDVALGGPELAFFQRFAPLEAGHAARLGHVFQQLGHVEALVVGDAAGVVLHRHHQRAGLGKQLAGNAAYVAETLHGDARAFDLQADVLGGLATHGEDAASGGLAPAQ